MNKIHPKIYDCLNIMRLTKGDTGLPFYAEFCLSVNFVKDNNLGTCAVNITARGLNFYYDEKFIDELTTFELIFVIVHEVLHLISRHNSRKNKNYHIHKVANIVMDMIINYNIIKMVNEYRNKKKEDSICFSIDGSDDAFNIAIPRFKDTEENREKNIVGLNSLFTIPKDYDDVHVFEVLYDWYYNKCKDKAAQKYDTILDEYKSLDGSELNDTESNDSGDATDAESDTSGSESSESSNENTPTKKSYSSTPNSDGAIETAVGLYGPFGKDDIWTFNNNESAGVSSILSDMIGKHLDDTVNGDYANALVKDIVNKLKSRGLVTGGVESIIGAITATKKDVLSQILKDIDRSISGSMQRERTYTRNNRREIAGLKGSRKYTACINIILDASGSMYNLIEIVLGYIFKKEVEINLIICDTEIKQHIKMTDTSQLNNLAITGFGGTIMQTGVDYVAENLNKYDTILLTDGYTDSLDLSSLNKDFMCITTGDEVDIIASNGRVIQHVVDASDY